MAFRVVYWVQLIKVQYIAALSTTLASMKHEDSSLLNFPVSTLFWRRARGITTIWR